MSITRRNLLRAAALIGASTLLEQIVPARIAQASHQVTACCWNGQTYTTYKLGQYYTPTTSLANRHRRMLDYLTGTCAMFGWQAVVGHALAAMEDGVNNSTDGWLQLISSTRQAFINDYWTPNNASGLTPSASEVGQWDVLNSVAGLWYFNSLSSGSFGKSYEAVQWKATQYNFGPLNVPSSCQPSSPSYAPSAYAWTLSFLAWGDNYASVTDASYGHATSPQRYARRVTDTGTQSKYLNPTCTGASLPTKPGFAPSYSLLTAPHGRRSTNKQFVILARHPISYVSGLAVALHIKHLYRQRCSCGHCRHVFRR